MIGNVSAPGDGFASRAVAWLRHGFAGLTWQGMALVALLCLINSLRSNVSDLVGDPGGPPGNSLGAEWLLSVAANAAAGLVVALPVALAVVATYNFAPRRTALRNAALALAVALSSLAGVIALLAIDHAWLGAVPLDLDGVLTYWLRYGFLCALLAAVFVYLRAADESTSLARDAERDRARFAGRTEEARLRMLQAQIEPHFLFNTLANVRRLYQTEPATAEAMLDSLMRYLETALPQMRANVSTLGREAELTASYLGIQRIRMGPRLTYAIEIAPALRDTPLPPMMLLTLAENAIKHGLAPLPEGGFVRISAHRLGDELELRVADSGRGFTQTSGAGTGLANIRARLAALYGATGRLSLAPNPPRGVTATIVVPLVPAQRP